MSWPDGERCLRALQSLVVSLLLSLVSILFFSRTRVVLSHVNLSRIGRIENSSCGACGHPSQDISPFILLCPGTDSLRHSLFGDSLSLYDLWSRPWRVARLLGLDGLRPYPHLSKGVGQSSTTRRTSVKAV